MNFCGVISFLLCSIAQCINIWFWNMKYTEYSVTQTMTWYTAWWFRSTGIFMTYLLFLHRIRTTFSNSTFEPSRLTLWSLSFLLTLYAILWLTVFILPLLIYVEGTELSREEMFDFQWKLSVPIAAVDILLSVSMTYIFVSRLYSLILMQTAIHYDESIAKLPGSTTMHSQHSLRRRTHKMSFLEGTHFQMIRISVKIGILAIVSLTSSLILLALRVTSFYLSYRAMAAKVAAMWLQIDTMISCVCLLLFLPRTQRGFDVFCCCCNAVLTRIMKKMLQIQTVHSLKSFEDTRAMEVSPHWKRTSPHSKGHVVHSTTCTPSSTALTDMATDIGHCDIETGD